MTFKITRRHAILVSSLSLVPTALLGQVPLPKSTDPLTVELTGVSLPVVRDGLLVNYIFGIVKIQFGDGASTFYLRDKSYLLRDAIVRVASRTPIPAGATSRSFDRVAVTRVVLQAIQSVRPNTRVILVTFEDAAFMRN